MKIKYLGTAAAEGFPAIFCNCVFCNEARRLGGKNVRTRHQTLINDDLLIDFPPDSYQHFLTNAIEGDRIKYLLITHSHSDHLYVGDLLMRHGAFARSVRQELKIIAGGEAYKEIPQGDGLGYSVVKISPYETVRLDGYRVTALPARHAEGTGALIYIIEGEKTLLYAHDTGMLYDEALSFIEKRGFVFDLVSFDCTNVDIPISDEGSHMGLSNIGRLRKRLEKAGAIKESTKLVINHFSHNAAPLYDLLVEKTANEGYTVSYDSMTVEI